MSYPPLNNYVDCMRDETKESQQRYVFNEEERVLKFMQKPKGSKHWERQKHDNNKRRKKNKFEGEERDERERA